MDAQATTTDFYAGINQPTAAPYMWAPLAVLSFGMLVLILAVVYLARGTSSRAHESFFD